MLIPIISWTYDNYNPIVITPPIIMDITYAYITKATVTNKSDITVKRLNLDDDLSEIPSVVDVKQILTQPSSLGYKDIDSPTTINVVEVRSAPKLTNLTNIATPKSMCLESTDIPTVINLEKVYTDAKGINAKDISKVKVISAKGVTKPKLR